MQQREAIKLYAMYTKAVNTAYKPYKLVEKITSLRSQTQFANINRQG